MFDLEMMKEIGYCHGIEKLLAPLFRTSPRRSAAHAARLSAVRFHRLHRRKSSDDSAASGHVSRRPLPQGNPRGARLPSAERAFDNRPLTFFEEFEHRVSQVLYVSATPGPYELTKSGGVVVEQIIRPTGLLDPEVEIRPIKGQVDDLLNEIRKRAALNQRVLVTTLTKRMAEDLAEYYSEVGVKCNYLHSEVSTLDRIKILRDLRRGEHDVLIGINLLREGLDLPEVSLVAILDADKEGFLRSTGALIQTMGRAARHLEGRAILYADVMTDSMKRAPSARPTGGASRRSLTYVGNSITPAIDHQAHRHDASSRVAEGDYVTVPEEPEQPDEGLSPPEREKYIAALEASMRDAARKFEFEKAARLRDRIKQLRIKDVAGIGIPA